MKRLIVLLLVVIQMLVLCSCAHEKHEHRYENETDKYGNTVFVDPMRRTAIIDKLPYDLKYNETSVALTDVKLYEMCPKYSHSLFIVVTLDVSDLDDAQLHWLLESDMSVKPYITCEKNGYDFKGADLLGKLHNIDNKTLEFVFTSSFTEENRHSFADSSISTTVCIKQEKDGSLDEALQYAMTVPSPVPDFSEMDQVLLKFVPDWLQEKVDSFSK